jgi:hypothetical protein
MRFTFYHTIPGHKGRNQIPASEKDEQTGQCIGTIIFVSTNQVE